MLATIISALTDSLLKQLFSFISQELEKRNLIAQGKAAQYTADLQASVQQAKDAAVIRESVATKSDSAVADDLDKLRQSSSSTGHG
jgi:hypothetical protein